MDEDRYEDHYESIANDEICALGYYGSYDNAPQPPATVPRCVRYHQSECAETALMNAPPACEDTGGSEDSANSLDDLCGGRRLAVDTGYDQHAAAAANHNARDHYMVPTARSPRELNERILSLFNPQFLPNFNNMITYAHSPPPRSQSMAQYNSVNDSFLLRDAKYRRRDHTNSMCFRRGQTYEAPRE